MSPTLEQRLETKKRALIACENLRDECTLSRNYNGVASTQKNIDRINADIEQLEKSYSKGRHQCLI